MSPFRLLSRNNLLRKLLIPALTVAVVLIVLRLILGLASQQPIARTPSLSPLVEPASGAQQVIVGFYPINVYSLEIVSNTYYVDTYVWFRWKGEIPPTENLEFSNAVEDWGMTQQPGYEKPKKLPSGEWYQIIRVEGRFFQPFELARYPLDQHRLSIQIENSIHTSKELVYLADMKDSGCPDTLSIQGWKLNGWQARNLLHTYDTRFGEPQSGRQEAYSSVQYELEISRPLSYFLWKLLLPLVIVLVSGWGAMLTHPRYVDTRTATASTALLTTVFLQQAYSYNLPEVGYLVLLDKIYALAYLLIIAAIMETIITADWVANDKEEEYERVRRLDTPFLICQCVALVLGVALLVAM